MTYLRSALDAASDRLVRALSDADRTLSALASPERGPAARSVDRVGDVERRPEGGDIPPFVAALH